MATDGEDYYSILNVARDATEEDIRASFKRLRHMYHPNKFVEATKEKSAKSLFIKIKEAYDVLINPVTRAVYDRRGHEGIRKEMDIIKRTALPLELVEKYEEMYQLWEDRTYIQQAHPTSRIDVELDARKLISKGQLAFLVTSVRGFQAVDVHVGQAVKAHLAGSVSAGSGAGSAGLTASFQQKRNGNTWKYSIHLAKKPTLGLSYIRNISPHTTLSAHGNLSFAPNSFLAFPPKCSLSIVHKLSKKLSASVTLHNVDLSNIQSSLTYNFNQSISVTASVDVGKSSAAVKAQVGAHLTESCMFKVGVKVGTSSSSVSYGLQHSVMKFTKLGSFVSLSPAGIHLRLTLHRMSQSYSVRIHLSDHISLWPTLCASVVPVLTYVCFSAVAILPLLRQQRQWEQNKRIEELKELAKTAKKEAEAAVELMTETAERVIRVEQAKLGLVINEAYYGKMHVADNRRINPSQEDAVIDVRLPLQCLIQDSRLILPTQSKADLTGFYDPCVGQTKWLYMSYDFRGFQHEVVVGEKQELGIPKESHRCTSPTYYNENDS